MTKSKSTKRAMLGSAISLVLCFAMLLGTTFAWFTDSVTSAGNIIKSGTLDVTMGWADGTKPVPTADEGWTDASKGAIFDYDKWEPGYTEVRHIKIANVGTLALKYQLNILATGTVSELADVIDVYFVDPATQVADREALAAATPLGTLTDVLKGMPVTTSAELLAGDSDTVTIALKMQESAGNEYQGKAIGSEFAVQLLATQYTYEKDSFDDQYDKDAVYTGKVVASEAELVAALAEAKNGDVISIKGNVTWTTGAQVGTAPFDTKATAITLMGADKDATFTAIGGGVGPVGIDGGTVVFKNLKIVDNSASSNEGSWEYGYLEFRGNTVFENCDIVNAVMMQGDSATFKNCTFNSNKASEYAAWIYNGNATFENCSFTGPRGVKVHSAYGGSKVGTVLIDGCTFNALSEKPGVAIDEANAKITIKNSTFINCQPGDQGLYIYETDNTVPTLENNEVKEPVQSTAGLEAAIKDGDEEIVLAKGNYTMSDGSSVNLQNKTLTISGTKDTVIDVSKVDERDQFVTGATLEFDGVTLNFDAGEKIYMGFANTASLTYKNCTIKGLQTLYGNNITFENCVLDSTGNKGEPHSVWTWGATNVTFKGCTFKYNGRAVNCYGEVNADVKVSFDNCDFIESASGIAPVEINSTKMNSLKVAFTNGCTVTGTQNKDLAYISKWATNKGTNVTVTVNGTAVTPIKE